MILTSNGNKKEYLYKKDISKFLKCGHADANRIFNEVKEFERNLLEIEMFGNRVPQDLFHEWRKRRKG